MSDAKGTMSKEPVERNARTSAVRGTNLVQFELSPRAFTSGIIAVASIWLVVRLFPIILVLVVALFLVGTLSPIVEWLEAHRVRRGLAIAIVFSLAVLIGLLLLALTVPSLVAQVTQLAEKEPAIRAGLVDRLSHSRFGASFGESLRSVRYDEIAKKAAASVLAHSTRAVEVLAYSASAVFLALYIMIDRNRLRGGLFALVPRSYHMRLARVLLKWRRSWVVTFAVRSLPRP